MFQENKDFISKGVFAAARRIFLSGVIVSATSVSLFAQTNPTLHEIDSLWRSFYGTPAHQCMIVYNKMNGGTTGDSTLDTLCVMRLVSRQQSAEIKNLFPFTQSSSPWPVAWGNWGVMSGYAVSKDGSRIAAQNGVCVIVCDSSGAHRKVVSTTRISIDVIALSFDDTIVDSNTVHRIVFASQPWLILRTTLSDTNTTVHIDTLWQMTTSDSCYITNPTYPGYTSVNKNGRFLSFNIVVNTGADIPIIVDLTTREYQLPLGDCYTDGCQIRSCWDSLGTVSFHTGSHHIPTRLWRWGTLPGWAVGFVPCILDTESCALNNGDCGQGGYYWCETDTNYLIQVGDNDQNASPGCYSKAYIRRGKTTTPPQAIYLGDYFGWPAMWIDPQPVTGVIDRRIPLKWTPRILMQRRRSTVVLSYAEGAVIDGFRLMNVRGVCVARSTRIAGNKAYLSISNLPKGVYVLSWRESNATRSEVFLISH